MPRIFSTTALRCVDPIAIGLVRHKRAWQQAILLRQAQDSNAAKYIKTDNMKLNHSLLGGEGVGSGLFHNIFSNPSYQEVANSVDLCSGAH